MSENVTVTISGPTGSGKSAVYYEIMVALQAIGVPVVHGDPAEVARQMRSGETDTHTDIEMYLPTVTLVERHESRKAAATCEEERYLIRKGGAFYRKNSQGYTHHREAAGRYTLAEAIAITHPNGPDGPRDGMDYILDAIPTTETRA